jgi:hypothetical protein
MSSMILPGMTGSFFSMLRPAVDSLKSTIAFSSSSA